MFLKLLMKNHINYGYFAFLFQTNNSWPSQKAKFSPNINEQY